MLPRLKPRSHKVWLRHHRRRCDDIRFLDSGLKTRGHFHPWIVCRHRLSIGLRAVPDGKFSIRKARAVSLPQRTPNSTRANDQDLAAVFTGELESAQQRVPCRLPFGYEMKINDRLKAPVSIRIEVHPAAHDRLVRLRIVRKDRGGFHSNPHPVDPCSTAQERVFATVEKGVANLGLGQLMPRLKSPRESNPVEQLLTLVERDHFNAHLAASSLSNPCDTRACAQLSSLSTRWVCQPRARAVARLSSRSSPKRRRSGAIPQSASTAA